jgi:ABC-type multidrug transport system fused ATPase/permease subunit
MPHLRQTMMLLRPLRDAGAGVVALLSLTHLINAVLPAATALATAALVSAAQRNGTRPGVLGAVLVPLVVLGMVVTASHAMGALLRPLDFLAAGRIDGAHRARVAELALGPPTVEELEEPAVQDLLRTTSADPATWIEQRPSDGALAQLNEPFRYLGLVASAAVLASYAWWLVPALAVPALVNRAVTLRGNRRHFRVWRDQAQQHRRIEYWSGVASSAPEGKELRIFDAGDWLVDRHQSHVRAYLDPVYADVRRTNLQSVGLAVLVLVPLAVVFYLVGTGTAAGRGSIATEAAVLTAAWSTYVAVRGGYDAIRIAGALPVLEAFERARERLPSPVAVAAPPDVAAGGTPPLVRFEGVQFAYGQSAPVLDGLDLEIRPGELLAVVGLNGAGKSTLVKLLAGLYRPTAGRITADGVDITSPDTGGMPAWRRHLAVVFQDFIRYHLSALDNVRLGSAGQLDHAALEAAAREAGLTDVVDRLPAGWDTPLARDRTDGVDLSGGQWQQVVLARALYAVHRGARILVLDEPTAHLDVKTEFEVFARLSAVGRRASVVLISHRLSTVRQADRIVLLDGGRVAEAGTHDELMARHGRYAQMFALQADRFTRGYDDRIDEEAPA